MTISLKATKIYLGYPRNCGANFVDKMIFPAHELTFSICCLSLEIVGVWGWWIKDQLDTKQVVIELCKIELIEFSKIIISLFSQQINKDIFNSSK